MGLFDFFKKPKEAPGESEAGKAPDHLAPPPPRSDLIQATQGPERALHERGVTKAELSSSNRITLSRSQTVDNSILPPAPPVLPQSHLPHARKLVLGEPLAPASPTLDDTRAATTLDDIQILPPPPKPEAPARASQASALNKTPSPIALAQGSSASLPALEFLQVLPAHCVAPGAVARASASKAQVPISKEEAIGLLSLGSFRFYACGVCDKLPPEYLTPMAARDESIIEIPLIKILPVIPGEWLQISGQDDSRLAILESINDPFRDVFVKQAPRSPTAPPAPSMPQQAPPLPARRTEGLLLPAASLASRLPSAHLGKPGSAELSFDKDVALELLSRGSFAPSYSLLARIAPALLRADAAQLEENCEVPLAEILPLVPPAWLEPAANQDRSRLATLDAMTDPFSGAFAEPPAKAKEKPAETVASPPPTPAAPPPAAPPPATAPKASKIHGSGLDLIMGDAFAESGAKIKEPTAFEINVEDTMIGRRPPQSEAGKPKTLPLRSTNASPPPPPETPPSSGIKPKTLPLKTNASFDVDLVEEDKSAPLVKAKSIPLKTHAGLDPAGAKPKPPLQKADAPKPRKQAEEDAISLDCVEEQPLLRQAPPPLRPGGVRKEIVSLEATEDGLSPRPSTEAQFIPPPPTPKPLAAAIPRPPKKPAPQTEFERDQDLVLVSSSTPATPKNLDTSVKEFSRSQAMKVEASHQPRPPEAKIEAPPQPLPQVPQAADDPARRSTAPCVISLRSAKADNLLDLPGYSPAAAAALIAAARDGRITDLASIAAVPGIDTASFQLLTGLKPGDSLLAAERRLNLAAGLPPDRDFPLSALLAGLARNLGWKAALLISPGGLRAGASGDTDSISPELDLAAAVIPQLIRRSSHSFGHAGLPPLNEISIHLEGHNLRFLPCGEAFLILSLPGRDPEPELMRRTREAAAQLAWYCSHRLVP
ncbi:MAG: hypothetical protein RL095_2657 [Verrucomicrobiota bacterium]|jgi:hypothetical protein